MDIDPLEFCVGNKYRIYISISFLIYAFKMKLVRIEFGSDFGENFNQKLKILKIFLIWFGAGSGWAFFDRGSGRDGYLLTQGWVGLEIFNPCTSVISIRYETTNSYSAECFKINKKIRQSLDLRQNFLWIAPALRILIFPAVYHRVSRCFAQFRALATYLLI